MPWHPLQQAHRVGDDLLYLIDPWMGPWAIVRRLRFDGEVWYRAVTFRERPELRELVGYSQNLSALVKHAYRFHMHRRDNTGPVNGWERAEREHAEDSPARHDSVATRSP